jgi:hypothetical protein
MLHTAIGEFTDSSLADLPRRSQALPGERRASTQNGSVKQFVAARCQLFQHKELDETDRSHRLCFHLMHVQASPVAA